MGVEISQNNQEISNDIFRLIRDGEFSDAEKNEIEEKYTQELNQIHREASNDIQELRKTMEIYDESLSLSADEISKIQLILSLSNRDGVFGPNTFAAFSDFSQRTGFAGGLQDLMRIYEEIRAHFEEIPDSQKRDYQPIGRKDGLYGQGTFEHIFLNEPDFISQDAGEENSQDSSLLPELDEESENVETETGEGEQEADDVFDVNQQAGEQETETETPLIENEEEIRATVDAESEELHETLSSEEKIEKFIQESASIPRMLVRILQQSVGAGVDGDFGPNTAQKVIEKYPENQSLSDIMVLEGIPMESDGVLPGEGGIDSRDALRARYGAFIGTLENNLQMPHGLVEAIIRQETHYGTYGDLISYSGCKGLMQLSGISMDDMTTNHRGNTIYRELFQSLNISELVSAPVMDGKTIQDMVPRPILVHLETLNNPESTDSQFDEAIISIQSFLKDDNSYFNHAMNLVMGSVYLSGTYHDTSRGNGNIRDTADHYNAASGERAKYRRNVEEYYNEIQQENLENTPVLDESESETLGETQVSTGPDDGLRAESFPYLEVYEKYSENLESSQNWIAENVTEYNMRRLALYFSLSMEDANFDEKLSLRIMDFQENNNLTVDGKPGNNTLSAIDFNQLDTTLLPRENVDFVQEILPAEWRDIGIQFIAQLDSNEILSPSDPITLCDSSNQTALYVVGGEYQTFPVIYGRNGFSDGYVGTEDGLTPRGIVMRFNRARIAESEYGDASNGQDSHTVLGASLQSDETQTTQDGIQTGKWFHGVSDARMERMQNTTIGCVGMSVQNAREIAQDIQNNNNKGYGFIA